MKALVFNNKIVDVVSTEFEVHSDLSWIDCPEDCTTEWSLESGVPTEPTAKAPLSYDQLRKNGYAPTGDQLDMLWHSIDAGEFGDTAKQSEFYTANKAVKDANPKP